MFKLKLQLEDLQIDSFSTTPVKRANGTVFGEQCTCPTACTCPGCPTCDASCNGTCGATCDASCNGTCGDTCDACTWQASCDSCYYGCYTYETRGPQGYCELCGAG